jgi:hypothetical protein
MPYGWLKCARRADHGDILVGSIDIVFLNFKSKHRREPWSSMVPDGICTPGRPRLPQFVWAESPTARVPAGNRPRIVLIPISHPHSYFYFSLSSLPLTLTSTSHSHHYPSSLPFFSYLFTYPNPIPFLHFFFFSPPFLTHFSIFFSHFSFIFLPIYLSTFPFINPNPYPFLHLFTHSLTYLLIHLLTYLPTHSLTYLFTLFQRLAINHSFYYLYLSFLY